MSVSKSCRYCKSPDCQGCDKRIWPSRYAMRNTDVKVVVGDKTYYPLDYDVILDVDQHTKLEINAYLAPAYEVPNKPLTITNVIFNPPATIVFWSDKTKTVVKCDYNQEPYDPEKGIAMAISKKMLGDNKYEYYNVFKHWLKRWNIRKTEGKTLTPPISEDTENPTEFYR